MNKSMSLYSRLLYGLCGVPVSLIGAALLGLMTDLDISRKDVPLGFVVGFIVGLIFPQFARKSFLLMGMRPYDEHYDKTDDVELAIRLGIVLVFLVTMIWVMG